MSSSPLSRFLFKNLANLITLGRIPLCFASLICAIMVIEDRDTGAMVGFMGVILLILSALTDYFDGYVARKFNVISRIGPLADQVMDKIVYCITLPTLAVGIMYVDGEKNIHHVILALGLCVTLLVRDHYVNFLRTIADRHQVDSGVKQIGKIRTLWALPTACVMYAYCFCKGEYSDVYFLNSLFVWVQEDSLGLYLIILEISLFVINVVSAISYTKTYGPCLLDEVCEGDDEMRRKILSIFPNSLTLMNAAMGTTAMFLAWNGRYHLTFLLLVGASVFDKLDGAAARKLGLTEDIVDGEKNITFGMLMDDIADLISFCIAPAVVAYSLLRDESYAPWLFLYAALGLARLIYFTLDKHPTPGYFKGLPSPAAALLVGGIVHFCSRFEPSQPIHLFIFCSFLATGFIMNAYFVKYIHFGKVMSQSKSITRIISIIVVLASFSVEYFGLIAILLMGAYLFSPLFLKPQPKTNAA
ncbi:MAG: CDP-alcohol phosphatidyltransferase family protein [Planctomycetes bacterium]|nr:CDP-alcohol phosphatidyltransferase family protein [Planctomycetota bacterium]